MPAPNQSASFSCWPRSRIFTCEPVRISPGVAVVTRMSSLRSSARSVSESPTSANLPDGVGGQVRHADAAAKRRDVEDARAAGRGAEIGQRLARQEERPPEVCVERLLEVLELGLLERRGLNHAGVVDEDVEPARLRRNEVDEIGDGAWIADVDSIRRSRRDQRLAVLLRHVRCPTACATRSRGGHRVGRTHERAAIRDRALHP